jgi:hypothetical protein
MAKQRITRQVITRARGHMAYAGSDLADAVAAYNKRERGQR